MLGDLRGTRERRQCCGSTACHLRGKVGMHPRPPYSSGAGDVFGHATEPLPEGIEPCQATAGPGFRPFGRMHIVL